MVHLQSNAARILDGFELAGAIEPSALVRQIAALEAWIVLPVTAGAIQVMASPT